MRYSWDAVNTLLLLLEEQQQKLENSCSNAQYTGLLQTCPTFNTEYYFQCGWYLIPRPCCVSGQVSLNPCFRVFCAEKQPPWLPYHASKAHSRDHGSHTTATHHPVDQMGSAIAAFLLQAILGVLDLLDAVYKGVFRLWVRLAAFDTRKASRASTGSRPPAPRVVGLILAEPDVSDISIRTVSRLTSWWVSWHQCCSSTTQHTVSSPRTPLLSLRSFCAGDPARVASVLQNQPSTQSPPRSPRCLSFRSLLVLGTQQALLAHTLVVGHRTWPDTSVLCTCYLAHTQVPCLLECAAGALV